MAKIIFCEDPLNPNQPDEMYQPEAIAALQAGFDYGLMNFESLVYERNSTKATRRIAPGLQQQTGLYRGWMLKPSDYSLLYADLLQKGIKLINDPTAYKHCHYLPESYEAIKHKTPRTVWMPFTGEVDIDKWMELLRPFGSSPIIVKDYVKSQKHYWHEACFIPDAADRQLVERVVRRFIELQDQDLNEGIVFREYVELEPLATHSRSGMPLTKEFRVFVLRGEPLIISPYWEEGNYQDITPPLTEFATTMKAVQSQFYTMDIARQPDGKWLIIELGDGQTAALPEKVEDRLFYNKLASILLQLGED